MATSYGRKLAALPLTPPNHCSHVVRYYEHKSKTDISAPLHQYAIAPWILLSQRANAYALTAVMPGRFNII